MPRARILINTFGSYGDLHPYIAIAHELQNLGHKVVIATSQYYRSKIESHGLEFYPVRPDITLDDEEMLAYVMDRFRGSERIIRYFCEVVRETYEDLLPACRSADLVITHPLSIAGVAIVEKLGLPWVSTVLAPLSFLSAWDPPAPAPSPWLIQVRALGVRPMAACWRFAKWVSRSWCRQLAAFRADIGLTTSRHPFFEGQHSPHLVLALFSRLLAEPQPDWPAQTVVTGFPWFDRHHEVSGLSPEIAAFLDSGPPPLVFTLGSSAVGTAKDFFQVSIEVAQDLGMRALLLAGQNPKGLPDRLPASIAVTSYAPHSEVFPRAAAVIHQGGVGTTAQAMRSGRPMLVVPFSHDQPDHGIRMHRLGVGRWLFRTCYNKKNAARELRILLSDSRYARRALEVAAAIARENGAVSAANAVHEFLSTRLAFSSVSRAS